MDTTERKAIFKSARISLGQMVRRFKDGFEAAERGEAVDTNPHAAERSKQGLRRTAWIKGHNAHNNVQDVLTVEAAAMHFNSTVEAVKKRASNGKSAHWVGQQIQLGAA